MDLTRDWLFLPSEAALEQAWNNVTEFYRNRPRRPFTLDTA